MSLKRFYSRTDAWLRGLPRGPYAVFIGISAGLGWLAVSLLLGAEFPYAGAFTIAIVLFTLELVTGSWQNSAE
ncbi:hypothetical protein Halru_3111 [Halovivax ruber XH-70]|uniref:Uncharacterized protein n=1 Tax=Halovivax ruber (strain DSM 18193 / JCM 13892 / XH-70) TaxID=797302 RepID=L0II67_HALRX|nr:hypothetical protein Halru_3111 [Halovivax ruber XH-70]